MTTVLSSAPVIGVIRAKDIERAKSFYRDKLGLQVEDESPMGMVAVVAGDGTRFAMYENPSLDAPGNTTLGFSVPDVAAAVEELRSKGVDVPDLDIPEMDIKTEGGIATWPEGKGAWFTDSEGNWIALNEM